MLKDARLYLDYFWFYQMSSDILKVKIKMLLLFSEQVAEVRNGPYGWIEEATTSEFESSPSDSELAELKENPHGDYEYYYHTPNPRKIREKTRTKTRESAERIRKDTDEGLPGVEEPETVEVMQQVMNRLGEGTEMEMVRHPDDVKRLFLTWLRKIQTQKQARVY